MNYAGIYSNIIEKRKNEVSVGYTEKHHIIPRSLGGSDEKDNLVKLTAKEHFICHLLLTKMYEKGSQEYYKMCHAFLMMLVKGTNQERYITSNKYESLKISFSERMSFIQNGKGNSQYGTKWIHNKELKQCKKVPKDAILETGWENGRIIIWDNLKIKVCVSCGTNINSGKQCGICINNKLIDRNKISKHASKKCCINGIIYDSVAIAAKELNIKPNSLQWRVNNMDNYYYI
jgi:hypothetical protein